MRKTYLIKVSVDNELTEYSDIEQAIENELDIDDIDLIEEYND